LLLLSQGPPHPALADTLKPKADVKIAILITDFILIPLNYPHLSTALNRGSNSTPDYPDVISFIIMNSTLYAC